DGGNLKGISARSYYLDEGCEVDHIANWVVMLGRVLDSKGQVITATTPIAGHWLKEEVYDKGKTYENAGPEDQVIALTFSCFRNPWIDPAEVERTIATMTDDAKIRRDFYGEWV